MPKVWIVREIDRGRNKPSLSREAALLMIGSVMSICVSLCTFFVTNKEDRNKIIREEVLHFNDQVAYDLGKRWNITLSIFRNVNIGDSSGIKRQRDSLELVKADWNMKIFAYRAKLNYYYNKELENEYGREIYNPLVKLGEIAASLKIDRDSSLKYIGQMDDIRVKIARFLEEMYSKSLTK